MFHKPANDCRGLSMVAPVATALSPAATRGEAGRTGGCRQRPIAVCATQRIRIPKRGRANPGGSMTLSTIDLSVVILYAIGIFALAQYVSREKAGHSKDSSDYFLASKNLPWWA